MDPWWLDVDPYFKPLIELHDKFENDGGFDKWRKKFADWAVGTREVTGLAKFLMDNFKTELPGSTYEWQLVEAIVEYDKPLGKTANMDNFNCWRGWFSGKWTTDKGASYDNYHIWDRTVTLGAGRYVQPVTQSRTDFYYTVNPAGERKKGDALEKAVKDKKVDLAIDITDTRRGITGWVQKYQETPEQYWPHLGILLDRTHLFWFAQNLNDQMKPNTMGDNEWFVFLEYGDNSEGAQTYQVRGLVMKIDDKAGVTLSQNAHFYGRLKYYCFTPYDTKKLLTGPSCTGKIPYTP
jgi:hypothetical protein